MIQSASDKIVSKLTIPKKNQIVPQTRFSEEASIVRKSISLKIGAILQMDFTCPMLVKPFKKL